MNIFVSNLSYALNSEDLEGLFAPYGEIASARVIMDRETGRSRGFGFVEMPNDEEGQKAIDELNGTEHDGKEINVAVARPREERPSFGGNRGGGGGYRPRREFDGERRGGGGYGDRRGGYGDDRRGGGRY